MTDYEYSQVKHITGLFHINTWAMIYSDALNIEVTREEAEETLERIWKENPIEGTKWKDITCSTEPMFRNRK